MIGLFIAEEDFARLRDRLLGLTSEGCAVLFANSLGRRDGGAKLVTHHVVYPEEADYTRRGRLEAELSPAFVARVTKVAKRDAYALVFVHSHPGEEPPRFSKVDDGGEALLAEFLARRHPDRHHSAMVVSKGGVAARRIGTDDAVEVTVVGENRRVVTPPSACAHEAVDGAHDRQIRAFGSDGQRALSRLTAAVVGLGGTGSLVVQQLAHLGVASFVLVDPDSVEATNLNRLVGATPADVGAAKVNVAARNVGSIAPKANVDCIRGDVMDVSIARTLVDADIIFGCTDSHGSRSILQQIAYQYFVPLIDMGVVIDATDSRIQHIVGRVQMLSPGLPCFACDGLLDPGQVRQDMMTASERRTDPYILGHREPAPAVISLNGTVASLSVTMLLAAVCGVVMRGRHLLYDAASSRLRVVQATRRDDCYICSRAGAFGRGDTWPLFGRHA